MLNSITAETPRVGQEGRKAIIHVNQAHIKHNAKHGTALPLYTIKVEGKTLYAWHVIKTGMSILEDHSQDPLSCGARAYDVTYSPLILLDINKQPFLGITFKEARERFGTAFTSMEDFEVCPLQKAAQRHDKQDMTTEEIQNAPELWYEPSITRIQGREVASYEARLRKGTFGCWDVFVIFEGGGEALYMRQITGASAKKLARDYNKKVDKARSLTA